MNNVNKFRAIIAAISYTGKVGKSSVTNNLLDPRMDNAKIFRIETINESGLPSAGSAEQKLKGRDIEKLFTELSKTDSAIVDVGTSNVESFVLGLTQQPDSHRFFDFFVVPVEANAGRVNEFKEAVKTLTLLNKLGVEPDRIIVIFNKLAPDCDIEDEMHRLFNFHRQNPFFTINKSAVIHDTQAFKSLADAKKSFVEVLADKTDYWKILKETPLTEEAERTRLVKMARTQGLVRGLNTELDCVFTALFGKPSKTSDSTSTETEFDVSVFD
jgi:hypothetical protein